MGNRRNAKRPWLRMSSQDETIDIPVEERVVIKEVPAFIKWAEIGNIDRDDVETVGRQVLYEDGGSDVIIDWETVSEDAKTLLGYYTNLGHYSIDPEQN